MFLVAVIMSLATMSVAEPICEESLDGPQFQGRATYFHAAPAMAGNGACMLASDDPMVVGMAGANYENSQVCGECIEVTGPQGNSVVVSVIDMCGCEENGLNLSQESFRILESDVSFGSIDVTWRVVTCDIEGNINYRFLDGSSKWWFGIQAINHKYPVARMELRQRRTNAWIDLERSNTNFFMKPTSISTIEAPFELRLTSVNGYVVTDNIDAIQSDELIEGTGQFGNCRDNYDCTIDERTYSGEATFYYGAATAAAGSGACMINTGGDLMIGAMTAALWDESQACGECVEVTGPQGDTVFIQIIDLCAGCPEGDINLSTDAFTQLGNLEDGRIDIEWKVVECVVDGNIKYKFKDGSSKWWFAFQIVDHRVPIKSIAIKPDGQDTWIDLPRQSFNFFLQGVDVIDVPFAIRVTGTTDEVLEDRITRFPSSMA
ncbi:uncharacterized protein LOC102803478 [Saccoglossus kowalevskii]